MRFSGAGDGTYKGDIQDIIAGASGSDDAKSKLKEYMSGAINSYVSFDKPAIEKCQIDVPPKIDALDFSDATKKSEQNEAVCNILATCFKTLDPNFETL